MNRSRKNLLLGLALLGVVAILGLGSWASGPWRHLPDTRAEHVTMHGVGLGMTWDEVRTAWAPYLGRPGTREYHSPSHSSLDIRVDSRVYGGSEPFEVFASLGGGRVSYIEGFQIETAAGLLLRIGDMVFYDDLEATLGPAEYGGWSQRFGVFLRFPAPSHLNLYVKPGWRVVPPNRLSGQKALRGTWVRVAGPVISARTPKTQTQGEP